MKIFLPCLVVAAMTALTLTPIVQAQAQPSGMYVSGGAGGALLHDLTIRNAGGAHNDVDAGYRGYALVGFPLASCLAAEFEFGALGNRLSTTPGQPLAFFQRANLYQYPLLGNLIFRAPLQGGFTPYIGAGAGGIVSTLDTRLAGDWERDSDCTFAYQGTAGIKYAINPNIDVGLGYKFLGTLNQSWYSDTPARFVSAGNLYSHSILATFTWNF